MSDNTQLQGRTLFTEREFDFEPRANTIGQTTNTVNGWGKANDPSRVGDDAARALYRWEMELQRQLYVGDVTKDAAAKQAAMDAMGNEVPDEDEDEEPVVTPPAPSPAPAPAPTPAPSPAPAPTPAPSPAPAPSPTPSP